MSLIDIAKAVAINCSLDEPTAVVSSTDPDVIKIRQFAKEAADEITRRVDWGELRMRTGVIGTGANDDLLISESFSRLTRGLAVTYNGEPVRGGVSPDEWASLVPVEGTPRYFRLIGERISFYPFLASGDQAVIVWQTRNWCDNGTDNWQADTDAPYFPENLVTKGALWRMKRHLGLDYQDYVAEFEAALADYASFDDGMRLP